MKSFKELSKEDKACKTPIEDLRKNALKHYEEASSVVCHWSSFVESAIKAYNPESTPSNVGEENNVLIFVENQSHDKPAGERYTYAEVCDLIFKYVSQSPSCSTSVVGEINQLNISKIMVDSKYKLGNLKNETANYVVDIPKASEQIYNLIQPLFTQRDAEIGKLKDELKTTHNLMLSGEKRGTDKCKEEIQQLQSQLDKYKALYEAADVIIEVMLIPNLPRDEDESISFKKFQEDYKNYQTLKQQ